MEDEQPTTGAGRTTRSRSNTPLPHPDRSTPTRTVEVEPIVEVDEEEIFTSPPAHRTRNALKHKTVTEHDVLDSEVIFSPIPRETYTSEEVAQNIKNYSYEYEQVVTRTVTSPNNGSNALGLSYDSSGYNATNRLGYHSRRSPTSSDKSNDSFAESVLADSNRVSVGGTEHLPYKLYKYAIEYWNKYPKTDYTYSHLSRDRVELAPGQFAVPNMSRLSLGQYRQGTSVYSGGLDEEESAALRLRTEELRKRWTSDTGARSYSSNYGQYANSADSDYDETDTRRQRTTARYTDQRWRITKLFVAAFTSIMTLLTTVRNRFFRRDSSIRYPYYSVGRSMVNTQKTGLMTTVKETVQRRKWWILLLLLLLLPFLLVYLYPESYDRIASMELSDSIIPDFSSIYLSLLEFLHLKNPLSGIEIPELSSMTHYLDLTESLSKYKAGVGEAMTAFGNYISSIGYLLGWPLVLPFAGYFSNAKESEVVMDKAAPFVLTDDIINSIVAKVRESLPETIVRQQAVEKFEVPPPLIDPEDVANQRQLIDNLYLEIANLKGQLSSNKEFNDKIPDLITKKHQDLLVNVFGIQNDGAALTNNNVKDWLKKETVSKSDLDEMIKATVQSLTMKIDDDVTRIIKMELMQRQNNAAAVVGSVATTDKSCHCDEIIRKIVNEALAIYDADKTGKVDYALESAGGQILSIRCTESYQPKTAVISAIPWIPFWFSWLPSNSPRIVIKPGTSPGKCWAFQGFPGRLVIKLHTRIFVTGFTLEHTPVELVPTGRIDSAPKKFKVMGLQEEMDTNPISFGDFVYRNDSRALQYFPVDLIRNTPDAPPGHEIIELQIDSNHGHPHYTCLYRFRVHGNPVGDISNGNIPER